MKKPRFIILSAVIILIALAGIIHWYDPKREYEKEYKIAYIPVSTATGTTTNATPQSIGTITIPTGATYIIEVQMLATSGSNSLGGKKWATFKNVAGTVSLVGISVTSIVSNAADAGLSTASWTMVASGATVQIQATGIAATTIAWLCNYSITSSQ